MYFSLRSPPPSQSLDPYLFPFHPSIPLNPTPLTFSPPTPRTLLTFPGPTNETTIRTPRSRRFILVPPPSHYDVPVSLSTTPRPHPLEGQGWCHRLRDGERRRSRGTIRVGTFRRRRRRRGVRARIVEWEQRRDNDTRGSSKGSRGIGKVGVEDMVRHEESQLGEERHR